MRRHQHEQRDLSATLIEQIADGDRDAFEQLLAELGDVAWSLALRVTNNQELAREAVQDAFVHVWRHAGTFDPHTASVVTWVLAYVRNKSIDRVRHESRRQPRLSDGARAETIDIADVAIEDSSLASDPFAQAWMSSQSNAVTSALAELNAQQRQVLELAYFDGLSQSEIAAQLDVPIGTIKTRTMRALDRLRSVLESRGEVEQS